MQLGSSKGKSMVDAIRAVIENAQRAFKKTSLLILLSDRFCAVVTIDVKNAFTSASWEAITVVLHSMRIPN